MNDVIIVGAGPAGASLALRLARAGRQVMMLERSRFPRLKVCGDYLCKGAIEALAALEVADDVLGDAHPIRFVALHAFGAHARFPLPGSGAVSLPRALLDDRLLSAAQRAGAQLHRGAFVRAHMTNEHVSVVFRDEHGAECETATRVLVGADGAWSAVARSARLAGHRRSPGPWAIGGELHGQAGGDELSMYISSDAYYARNPLAPRTVNTMLVAPKPPHRDVAETIVDRLSGGKLRFEAARMQRIVAIGPLRYRAWRLARGRILLTGDAAELLDPFTGQGVAAALALSAPASAAVEDLLRGEPESLVERRYAARWRGIVGPRRMLTRLVHALIHNPWLRRRALRGMRRDTHAAHAIVAAVSGDWPVAGALPPCALLRLLAS
ncbi:MAG: FAD-dependent monooxygenase [Candidatus Eremiobacteraeota bacterium]|nr:FAD-dependent monooxygenase [Candidatus Eremiobacteraeota bacterium]